MGDRRLGKRGITKFTSYFNETFYDQKKYILVLSSEKGFPKTITTQAYNSQYLIDFITLHVEGNFTNHAEK